MKATKQIDIYLIKRKIVKVIDVVQYDKGIQLVFNVKDFSIPTGTTGTLYVQKPSGKFVYQEKGITVSDNAITIDLENQAIAEHGKVPYQVTLTNGSDEITTFEGLMMVQRSLKDAGATESTTVIRAFDDAVSERVAEFRTQAETIAAGVIATIPEDYTAMSANVNELANAIKGTLKGAVVVAGDVSPVEHIPKVWVHGKNLFDTSKIQVQASTDNIYISAVGEGYIDITTKEAYDGNGHCVTWIKLKELCPQMKAGKQYALSGTTTAWNKMIYLKEMDLFWSYGTRYVVTEEMLECTIGFYGLNSLREQGFGTCRISNIQCEEGYDITDYEPYIDPTTATVRRCGKNLLSLPYYDGQTITRNGITCTVNADGSVKMVGTATSTVFFRVGQMNLGTSPILAGNSNGVYALTDCIYDSANKFIYCQVNNGETVNKTFYPQVEYGTVKTAFESPYEEAEYIPASDGTVTGMTSLSPNMTILTDTEGVIVECEYNKDTNKVIQKICDVLGIEV